MPRELEDFRPYMEDIIAWSMRTYGVEKRVLLMKEAEEYTGKSYHWFTNRGIKGEIGIVQLARLMAQINR